MQAHCHSNHCSPLSPARCRTTVTASAEVANNHNAKRMTPACNNTNIWQNDSISTTSDIWQNDPGVISYNWQNDPVVVSNNWGNNQQTTTGKMLLPCTGEVTLPTTPTTGKKLLPIKTTFPMPSISTMAMLFYHLNTVEGHIFIIYQYGNVFRMENV